MRLCRDLLRCSGAGVPSGSTALRGRIRRLCAPTYELRGRRTQPPHPQPLSLEGRGENEERAMTVQFIFNALLETPAPLSPRGRGAGGEGAESDGRAARSRCDIISDILTALRGHVCQPTAGYGHPEVFSHNPESSSAMNGHRKACRRFHEPGHAHSLMFSCFSRRPFLADRMWVPCTTASGQRE